jgi:hypothetical protein
LPYKSFSENSGGNRRRAAAIAAFRFAKFISPISILSTRMQTYENEIRTMTKDIHYQQVTFKCLNKFIGKFDYDKPSFLKQQYCPQPGNKKKN